MHITHLVHGNANSLALCSKRYAHYRYQSKRRIVCDILWHGAQSKRKRSGTASSFYDKVLSQIIRKTGALMFNKKKGVQQHLPHTHSFHFTVYLPTQNVLKISSSSFSSTLSPVMRPSVQSASCKSTAATSKGKPCTNACLACASLATVSRAAAI